MKTSSRCKETTISSHGTAALLALLLLLPACLARAQTGLKEQASFEREKAAAETAGAQLASSQLAMSSPDYPVTAGDVYSLVFMGGSNPVTYTIPVDSTYKIRVANLGVLNCADMTFNQLKTQVVLLVTKNYPMGGVQFVLSSPANFLVSVMGEVRSSEERKAWALTRLSDVVEGNLTDYSSVRSITVRSAGGAEKSYDLFRAARDGNFSQNPYVRPGDKIIIGRLHKKVTVSGAVERPGTYELLPGENLSSLVRLYGGGLTEYADTARMVLNRFTGAQSEAGDAVYLSVDALEADFSLENNDSVMIPSSTELRGTMFFEGAVGALGREEQEGGGAQSGGVQNPVINRIPVGFLSGENLASLVRQNAGAFFPTSDLRNAYLIRDGEKFLVNLEDCLYKRDFLSEFSARRDDTLYVPYMQTSSAAFVRGEVKESREVEAWPLKRLDELIKPHLTGYSSLRNVRVTGVDGVSETYDLFRASRFGEREQNPYVRPGETVTVGRIDRKVTVSGAVERPGTYELLPGENLKSLVSYYGNGLAPLADTGRIELYRSLTSGEDSGEKLYLSGDDIEGDYELLCYDSVTVSSFRDLQPTIFVEGAVNAGANNEAGVSNRIAASVSNGEDYAFFARRNKSWFSAVSDLESAYIVRGDELIPINLSLMLYDASYYSSIEIQSGDILRVPFRQYFVSVSGAVNAPGRYPFIPDRKWDYYVALAGGIIKTQNARDAMDITDMAGKPLSKKDVILPESIIDVRTNSLLYYFNQYAPVLTTVLSLVATSISVLVVSGAL